MTLKRDLLTCSRSRQASDLQHKHLREDTPSILKGRTVKHTLTAVTAMQGIKLVGVADDTVRYAYQMSPVNTESEPCETQKRPTDRGIPLLSNAAAKLGEAAWDLKMISEHSDDSAVRSSIEVLIDAFPKGVQADGLDFQDLGDLHAQLRFEAGLCACVRVRENVLACARACVRLRLRA